ncbi:MAG: hypothetical protein HYY93_15795 [Planctomycetes bacterium]|nr:hypothetical protein [Planctomycetota bacterium]
MAKDSDTKAMTALYDVIVTVADGPRIDEASGVFARSFSISPESAGQVLKCAPIIFLSGIKRSEIRTIKSALYEVSKYGVEFKLTSKPSPAIPRVVWPTKPNIETLGHTAAIPALGFTFGNAAITCPSCGEVLVVRQLGKPVIHPAAPATPSSSPALKPAPAPAPSKPAARAAPPPPKPEPKPAKKPARVEEPEEIEEPLELVEDAAVEAEEVEEVPTLDDTLDVGEPLEEVEEVPELEEEPPKRPAAKGGKLPAKPEPRAAARPVPKAAAKPAPKVDEEETLEVAEEPEVKAPKPTPSRVAADGEPLFSVFLSKIGDPAKQAEAAKLIAEIRGIPLKEAKEKAKGMLIPVLKDVSKDEADACLEKFQKLKIPGKVTKKK